MSSTRWCWIGAAALALVTALAATSRAAAPGRPTARAQWVEASPTVDGQLDDAAWKSAARFGGFLERGPRLRAKPPVETRFAVVFDARTLYVGVWCDDDRPEEISGKTLTRDTMAIFRDDAISVKLDPALDRRTTYGFALNASGAKLDYRGVDERSFRTEVDTLWEGAAARTADGWTAEFAIPLASLGLDATAPPKRVGLNFSRDHARRNATYDWALLAPPYSPIAASQYGTLVGLDEQPQRALGKRWYLAPYLLGGFRREPAGGSIETVGVINGGLDVGGELGRGWRGQLTINTDFAQVDVDDQVVNLTRFGLFLPEKRDFFLQDLELFDFGRPQEAQLLHTRRIGLHAGQEVPIMGGLKLFGRPEENVRLGLIHVATRPGGDLPWTGYTVARAVLELGGGSNVGLMVTSRQSYARLRDQNLVLGLDGAWRDTASPLLFEAFALVSFAGRQSPPPESAAGGLEAPSGRPAAGASATISWRGELVRPSLEYSYFHPELRADLGFFERVGIHQVDAAIEIEPRLDAHGLEKLTLEVDSTIVATASADRLLDWDVAATAALSGQAGYVVGVAGNWGEETVERAFEVGRQTVIEPGTYDLLEAELFAELPSTWLVSGSLSALFRTWFGGEMWALGGALTARPVDRLRLELAAIYNHVLFPDARPGFDSVVVNGRVAVGITTELGVDLFAGWSWLTEELRAQLRARWTWMPGSDLYLVYQLDLDTRSGGEQFQSLLLKLSLRWPWAAAGQADTADGSHYERGRVRRSQVDERRSRPALARPATTR